MCLNFANTHMNNFQLIEAVDHGSKTQLQVTKNLIEAQNARALMF